MDYFGPFCVLYTAAFNLDFLKIANFRSIEFVETLNQREFDGLPSFFYSMCIFWSFMG